MLLVRLLVAPPLPKHPENRHKATQKTSRALRVRKETPSREYVNLHQNKALLRARLMFSDLAAEACQQSLETAGRGTWQWV